MKKTFYGGTFNPPHLGHLRIGRAVLERGLSGSVLFVPAWIPPHKTGEKLAPYADRLEMLKLLTAGEPGFEVSDFERGKGGVSYTVETLRKLSELHPDDEFQLLIGSDSLRQLHLWYMARELAAEFPVLWYPRGGQPPVTVEELARNWPAGEAEKLFAGKIPGMPLLEVSSTDIRDALRRGEKTDWLTTEILNYIQKRRLYEYGRQH